MSASRIKAQMLLASIAMLGPGILRALDAAGVDVEPVESFAEQETDRIPRMPAKPLPVPAIEQGPESRRQRRARERRQSKGRA